MSEVIPATLLVRVERIEYADIEVDTAGLMKEWADASAEPWTREDIFDALYAIGVRDLMYSGDFITVLDSDTEETIRLPARRRSVKTAAALSTRPARWR